MSSLWLPLFPDDNRLLYCCDDFFTEQSCSHAFPFTSCALRSSCQTGLKWKELRAIQFLFSENCSQKTDFYFFFFFFCCSFFWCCHVEWSSSIFPLHLQPSLQLLPCPLTASIFFFVFFLAAASLHHTVIHPVLHFLWSL